ncbi:MAG: ABC transporter permease [Acidimicrobiia bacterium]
MRLAIREMLRRPGRFMTAAVLLTLIAMLLMLLGGLLDGLILRATGAINAQRADLVVFSATAEKSFLRSRITPETRAQVAAVPGVESVGGIGVTQLGARVPGNGPRDLADVALFGYQQAPDGVPAPPPDGEVWADSILKDNGVKVGQTLKLGPARSPVKVKGFVDDVSYSGAGSLWASPQTWREVQNANRPASSVAPGVFQALLVRTKGDPSTVADAIDRATAKTPGGATETVTRNEASDAIGGVKQQRSVFNQIIGVTLVIATVVVALFFALLTVERVGLYGVLKAIGARSRTLFGGVVVQATVVAITAAAVGTVFAVLLDVLLPPGAIPYQLLPSRVVISSVSLIIAAIVGSTFSLRRVLRVDPASAIGRAS